MMTKIKVVATFSIINKVVEYTLFINKCPIRKFANKEDAELENLAYINNRSKLSWVLNTICNDKKRESVYFKNNEILNDRFERWAKVGEITLLKTEQLNDVHKPTKCNNWRR